MVLNAVLFQNDDSGAAKLNFNNKYNNRLNKQQNGIIICLIKWCKLNNIITNSSVT